MYRHFGRATLGPGVIYFGVQNQCRLHHYKHAVCSGPHMEADPHFQQQPLILHGSKHVYSTNFEQRALFGLCALSTLENQQLDVSEFRCLEIQEPHIIAMLH